MDTSAPDFTRDVQAVLGLPFDAIDLDAACARVRDAALRRKPCFFSTPNLNFAIACRDDAQFRQSVLASDLILADGAPIVWVARLTGASLRQRVAGASLFERLRQAAAPALRVFFFGGPDGAAQQACERLNVAPGGLAGVGALSPGFVSVDAMSDERSIGRVNDAQPDFVLVALGARKGQEWIMRNRARLTAPVVSHLGAVVNFTAGTVARAPALVQMLQLEWLWRIKEEPGLWRRYWHDGLALLRTLAAGVLPLALARATARVPAGSASLTQHGSPDAPVLALDGHWQAADAPRLRERLAALARDGVAPALDLRQARHLDPATLGTLMLLHGWCTGSARPWRVVGCSDPVRRLLRWHGATYLLTPTKHP
jgi:N-acetylglucosaminyldiphosphoundecaprenol N-acetyl-beta-D-mannosaminyltransferase